MHDKAVARIVCERGIEPADAGVDKLLRGLALAAEDLEHACLVLVRYADEHEMLAVLIVVAEHIRYRRTD